MKKDKDSDLQTFQIVESVDSRHGGYAEAVIQLCKFLKKHGVNSEIFSLKLYKKESNSALKENHLICHSYPYFFHKKLRFSIPFRKGLQTAIQLTPNALIHIHNLWNYVPYCAYKLGKKHSKIIIVSVRGTLYERSINYNRLRKIVVLKIFFKRMLNNVDCIHVTEQNELEAVRKLGITVPVAIIPDGIDISAYSKLPSKLESKKQLGWDLKKKYVLFLSRIHPIKGLDLLVKGWLFLAEKYPLWDLVIVGPIEDQAYFKKVLALIEASLFKDRVKIVGLLSGFEKQCAYCASDLFVLPSYTENFGIVIAEAMVSRVPVITTINTPWKILKEKNVGWWIDLTLTNLIGSLEEAYTTEKERLAHCGEESRAIILDSFGWDKQALAMKELYFWLKNKTQKPIFVDELQAHL